MRPWFGVGRFFLRAGLIGHERNPAWPRFDRVREVLAGTVAAEEPIVHATYLSDSVPAYLSLLSRAIVVLAAATPRLSVT